jgi:uncharacterized membrane protein YraQ (UPF0718 family)
VASFDFLSDPAWRKAVASTAFGKSFWGFAGAAVGFGVLCWLIKGPDEVSAALNEDLGLLADLMPRVVVALSIAALIWVMMPRERMSALVGSESGMRGLIIATIAGTVTPGGPSSAYALLAAVAVTGADRGALVAYITAWATLGLQRILIWDVPFMGAEFAILRFAICIPLPIIAGLIARRLPRTLRIKGVGE